MSPRRINWVFIAESTNKQLPFAINDFPIPMIYIEWFSTADRVYGYLRYEIPHYAPTVMGIKVSWRSCIYSQYRRHFHETFFRKAVSVLHSFGTNPYPSPGLYTVSYTVSKANPFSVSIVGSKYRNTFEIYPPVYQPSMEPFILNWNKLYHPSY